jgi:DNA-binding NarL/FixJ family response regulator
MPARPKPSGGFTHRVLVADAYATSRAGIRAAMAPYGYAVAAEAADMAGAIDAARRERPDVCLVSLTLPGGGVDAIRAIAEDAPGIRIVALGDDDSDDDAVAALAAGAIGFLVRASALERLPATLAAAIDGQALVPATLMARLAQRAERERRDALWRTRPRTTFSPRERQVLEGLRAGGSTTDIAVALGLSAVTVRRYVSLALRKAGVSNRVELVEMLRAREDS